MLSFFLFFASLGPPQFFLSCSLSDLMEEYGKRVRLIFCFLLFYFLRHDSLSRLNTRDDKEAVNLL